MKRLLGALMVIMLALALRPLPATAHTEDAPLVADLLAGQHTDVGDVLVWNDLDYLYVKFVYDESLGGLGFSEVHLQVAYETWPDRTVTKKGNPIPGHFEYKHSNGYFTEYTFVYELEEKGWDECGALLMIAAHAVVGPETAWGCGTDNCIGFIGKNWATYFEYEVQCPVPEFYETVSVGYEDLPLTPPGANDWDYNDLLLDIQTGVTGLGAAALEPEFSMIGISFNPVTKTATYTHTLMVSVTHFACTGSYELFRGGVSVESGDYVSGTGLVGLVLIEDTGDVPFDEPEPWAQLVITFPDGCSSAFPVLDPEHYHGEDLFFDLVLHVNQNGEYDIFLGDKRVITVPADWEVPAEAVPVCAVYPGVTDCDPGPPTFSPDWWMPPP
jgi:hypothetical protein